MTSDIKQIIEDDLTEIINEDPRVILKSINLSESDHSVTASISVDLLPEKEPVTLTIDLQRE